MPLIVSAQTTFKEFVNGTVKDLLSNFAVFLFAVALLVFLWGMAKFILKADSDTEREKGKQVMIWGLIALFVMLSVWGIVHIITITFFEESELQFFLPEEGSGFESIEL
ncbi:MAG: hypothetical protein ACQEP6_01145 [Patescibacteria group bacterium]